MDEVQGEVLDIREELEKHGPPGRGGGGGGAQGGYAGGQQADGDNAYTAFNLQQQQELMADQDLALEGVSRTVGNLREQAHEMNRELEEQREMIEEVDRDAERVESKLKRGVKDLNGFIRKNEGIFMSPNGAGVRSDSESRYGKFVLHRGANFGAYCTPSATTNSLKAPFLHLIPSLIFVLHTYSTCFTVGVFTLGCLYLAVQFVIYILHVLQPFCYLTCLGLPVFGDNYMMRIANLRPVNNSFGGLEFFTRRKFSNLIRCNYALHRHAELLISNNNS